MADGPAGGQPSTSAASVTASPEWPGPRVVPGGSALALRRSWPGGARSQGTGVRLSARTCQVRLVRHKTQPTTVAVLCSVPSSSVRRFGRRLDDLDPDALNRPYPANLGRPGGEHPTAEVGAKLAEGLRPYAGRTRRRPPVSGGTSRCVTSGPPRLQPSM